MSRCAHRPVREGDRHVPRAPNQEEEDIRQEGNPQPCLQRIPRVRRSQRKRRRGHPPCQGHRLRQVSETSELLVSPWVKFLGEVLG